MMGRAGYCLNPRTRSGPGWAGRRIVAMLWLYVLHWIGVAGNPIARSGARGYLVGGGGQRWDGEGIGKGVGGGANPRGSHRPRLSVPFPRLGPVPRLSDRMQPAGIGLTRLGHPRSGLSF